MKLEKFSLCILMTCFNRRETTLKCLDAIENIRREALNLDLSLIMVDDNSSDGTAEAALENHPWIHVIQHKAEPLFWCRGMHKAFTEAMYTGFEYYVLLNDDTILTADAVQRLLDCENQVRTSDQYTCIVVGSTQDAIGGNHTYGGKRLISTHRPIKLKSIAPTNTPQPLDTFNGNIVLIPCQVASKIGNLDPTYEHAFGDIDYGLRARKAGIDIWLATGFHGFCQLNSVKGTYHDLTLPIFERWNILISRKYLPFRSWARFTKQHAGLFWPLYFIYPYLKFFFSSIFSWSPR